MPETKIWPVEEMIHEDEFTDRMELRYWARSIQVYSMRQQDKQDERSNRGGEREDSP